MIERKAKPTEQPSWVFDVFYGPFFEQELGASDDLEERHLSGQHDHEHRADVPERKRVVHKQVIRNDAGQITEVIETEEFI